MWVCVSMGRGVQVWVWIYMSARLISSACTSECFQSKASAICVITENAVSALMKIIKNTLAVEVGVASFKSFGAV